jgi:hypothetical protein
VESWKNPKNAGISEVYVVAAKEVARESDSTIF